MHDIMPKLTIRDLLGYVMAYMFWLLAASISLVAMFVARMALNAFWPAMNWNRWVLRPVDRFGLVFMGLVWLVYVIFCEQYLRSAITTARVRRMNDATRITPRPEQVSKSRFMTFLTRMGLDILARRLVPTLLIPLGVLGLSYLIYSISWVIMAR